MKWYSLLPLAVFGSAFVVPSKEAFAQIALEDNGRSSSWQSDILRAKEQSVKEIEEKSSKAWSSTQDLYDSAKSLPSRFEEIVSDNKAWLEDFLDGRPHDPHHTTNLTVYQLIAGSKYTTKLAKYINEYDDLVDALNSTKANFTVFAPTDKAFAKIPDHAPTPSKEFIKDLLTYHVVPGLYPAGRVLSSRTAPTLLKSNSLGYKPHAQRISFQLGLRGVTVNFFSRVVAINIEGTNGVIHGIDSILVPPPGAIAAIDLFPGQFSTLELGLAKTGLLDKLNTTDHAGGTLFAPSNFAFQKLGPRVNAFLFSRYGLKYLEALLTYHVVPDRTLYSDAYIDATKEKDDDGDSAATDVPKGVFHVDLPTYLKDRSLSVDVARYGGLVNIRINGYSDVTVSDGIAQDGVIHMVSNVLIPPKKIGGAADGRTDHWQSGEMSLEELIERLSPFVAKGDL